MLLTDTIEVSLEDIGDGVFHEVVTDFVKSKFSTWGAYKILRISGNKLVISVDYETPKVRNRSGLIEN